MLIGYEEYNVPALVAASDFYNQAMKTKKIVKKTNALSSDPERALMLSLRATRKSKKTANGSVFYSFKTTLPTDAMSITLWGDGQASVVVSDESDRAVVALTAAAVRKLTRILSPSKGVKKNAK